MGKFGSSFMMKSPIKKHGDQYREKAKKLSEKSGTPGDYNRDDPKVNKQLDKADKADAEHKDSPLEGAYTSGAGGQAYVSNRQDFQQLQDRIAGAAISIMAGENDPETRSKRLNKRIKARDKRAGNKGPTNEELVKAKGALDVLVPGFENKPLVNEKRTKFDGKTQELRERKEGFDKEIEEQKKSKKSQKFLTAAEKTEITKQHYLDEGGEEDDWNAMTPKAKKEAVLEYRTYYGFN